MQQENDKVREALSARDTEQSARTLGALKTARRKSDEPYQAVVRRVNAHAEEFARLQAMIAEYEQSSHFTPGIVRFTGLTAGKNATRAYQVYLADQSDDLFWLTVKDGKLKEIEFKVQPGQQGGLEVERIK